MEYCVSAFSKNNKNEVWKIYMSDGVYTMSKSLAKIAGGEAVSKRYVDLVSPIKKKDKKEKTAKEVISNLKKGLEKLRK